MLTRRVPRLALLLALAGALLVPLGTVAAAAPATYKLAGIEYAATATQGTFAGAAVSASRDDYGTWRAVVTHDPLGAVASITGGSFVLDGRLRDYAGPITGGTIHQLTTSSCSREQFTIHADFAYTGGTGGFDGTLTHYRLRTSRGACLTYAATISGTATFTDGPPSAQTVCESYGGAFGNTNLTMGSWPTILWTCNGFGFVSSDDLTAKYVTLGDACLAGGGTGYSLRGVDATLLAYFTCGHS